MSKIFISHSSVNNAAALAVAQWLGDSGWAEHFLDITPARGLAPGERWQEALKSAADRCEAVLFLISPAWQASRWCLAEFLLAKQLGKSVFGVVVDETQLEELPREMTAEWQLCDLMRGTARRSFRVSQEPIVPETEVSFAEDGLARLRIGLQRAGLDPVSFPWPPHSDPNRAPYRGLKALEPEDAAIFFGREAAIVRGLDALRGVRDRGVERLFVILGASGAGKSSFLRAGLWPRLVREDRHFLPLPVIRPERAAISGATGLAASLEVAFRVRGRARTRAAVNETLKQHDGLDCLLAELQALAMSPIEHGASPPTVIIAIDQGDELFGADGGTEAERFLDMLALTLSTTALDGATALTVRQRALAIVAIRSDAYERLQTSPRLVHLAPYLFSLPPVASAEFKAVVEGPARRHTEAGHRLAVDPALTERLVHETEGADALPLLAFTLERLFVEHGGAGKLCLDDYEALGGVRGSIEAAVEAAFAEPGREPPVPADKALRDHLLRSGFIPWLARVDPDTEDPKRRVASWEEIPGDARPLLERLIEQRLLVRDRRRLGRHEDAVVVEVAHEALLRQWPMLTNWLREDAQALKILDAVQRAAAEWAKNRGEVGGVEAWLVHTGERLTAAEALRRADFKRLLGADGQAYLDACRARDDRIREEKERRDEAERLAKERELAQAKALAEAQRQRADAQAAARVRQRRFSRALLALLVLAVATAVYGWQQGRAAKNQHRLAASGELAADALGSVAADPELSLLLALEAASLSYSTNGTVSAKTQDALHRVMQTNRARVTLSGHQTSVSAVAYSPDGRLVATAHDGGVRLWDSASGRELETRFATVGSVLGIAFSPNGKHFVTAGNDNAARVWDIASGRELSALRGHTGLVWSVTVSPDGSRIATASRDKTVKIWEFGSARLLYSLAGHSNEVAVVSFSPDGKLLATGSDDGSARIWETVSGQQLREIRVGGTVSGLAFSPDGRRIATVGDDAATVRFWDVASGRELRWDGHTGAVFAVAYSPDGKQLATVSLDNTVKLWDTSTGKQLFALPGHSDAVVSVAFSPDGKRLVTGSEDTTARIWDVSSVAELPTLTGHTGTINQVVYSPDGKHLATASDDATARIWDARNGQELMVVAKHEAAVKGVAFSPDGKRLATAGADKSAKILELETGRELFTLLGHRAEVNSVAFSRDGRRLATGSFDKTAKIWDFTSGRELATVSAQVGQVYGVALDADGSRVALAVFDDNGDSGASAQLWDWASHKELLRLNGDHIWVNQIAFSPDSKQLATAGSTPPFAVKIWNVASGSETLTLSGHPAGVLALAYSPDGKRLATGGYSAAAKVWDTGSGRELLDLPGHVGSLRSVAFSPDGKRVATAGSNWLVQIYAVEQEDLLTLARSRLTRGLTAEECRRYLRRQDCSGTSTSLLVAGKDLMKSGQRDAAFVKFRAALKHDGVDDAEASARKLLATLIFVEGSERARVADLAGAKQDFQAADALHPLAGYSQLEAARQVAAAQVQAAFLLEKKGEWTAAIKLLQTATGLDPKNERAYRELAWAYNNSDQHDKAIDVMRKVLEIYPTPSNLVALAQSLRMKEDYAEAIELLTKALTISPNKSAYVEIARAYRKRKQFVLALESIGQAKRMDPDYADAYGQAARIYHDDLHNYEAAYREYKKVISLSPDESDERANFAEACLTSAHFDEAYRTALELLQSARTKEELDEDQRLGLRFIVIAALLLQGRRAEAQAGRGELAAYLKTLRNFDQNWDYRGTRNFILRHPMSGADRAFLLDLLNNIESPARRTTLSRGQSR
jgi:WD40 repeat protein/Tfp pilus assembly protein PilF